MSKDVYNAVLELKKFNYENIYSNAMTKEDEERYSRTIVGLYNEYKKALENHDYESEIYKEFLNNMSQEYLDDNCDSQKIIDYISGMTDNYLQRKYEKYK